MSAAPARFAWPSISAPLRPATPTAPVHNAGMTSPASPAPVPPLAEADLNRLQTLLDKIPEPLEPLDISMLDGYLCGVLLQPTAVPAGARIKHVFDIDGRPLNEKWPGLHELQGLVQRRYRELMTAISGRQWFDPWVFELDDETEPLESTLPWVAGFSAAMEMFPALMNMDSQDSLEPLAVLYAAFDPEDLEDADALLAEIETLEPPSTLDEAIEDIVQSVMRLADSAGRCQRRSRRRSGHRHGGGRRGAAGSDTRATARSPNGRRRPSAGRLQLLRAARAWASCPWHRSPPARGAESRCPSRGWWRGSRRSRRRRPGPCSTTTPRCRRPR